MKTKGNVKFDNAKTVIDAPESCNDHQDTDERLENRGAVPAAPGTTQAERKHQQSDKRHKHAQYAVRSLKAIGRGVVVGINWIDSKGPFVTALATVAIAALSWRYVHYSRAQWKAMQDQLPELRKSADAAKSAAETASKTMKLAYRPRVTLLGINPLVQSMVNGKLVTTLDSGPLKVGIDLPNIGPFAARNVRFFRFDNLSPRDQITKLPYEELRGEPKVIPPKAANSSIGLTVFGKRTVSKSELTRLQRGEVWVTFSILVAYDDDFGETHHTEYCSIFTLQPYNDICPWPVQND